jgi:preprotein translocase subunit SecA
MRKQVPASGAFDMMRRQNLAAQQAAARKAAAEAAQAAQGQQAADGAAGKAEAPAQAAPPRPQAPAGAFEGTGRNDPCPCGSGKKFKKCHGS